MGNREYTRLTEPGAAFRTPARDTVVTRAERQTRDTASNIAGRMAVVLASSLAVWTGGCCRLAKGPSSPRALPYDIHLAGVRVGQVELSYHLEDTPPRLTASGMVALPFVSRKATMETELDSALAPKVWTYLSGDDGERLVFEGDTATLLRLKHCRDPACVDPHHFVSGEHCKICDNPAHKVWRKPRTVSPAAPDVLTALYRIRTAWPFRFSKVSFLWSDGLYEAEFQYDSDEELTLGQGVLLCHRFRVPIRPLNAAARKLCEERKRYVNFETCLSVWFARADGRPVKLSVKGHYITDLTADMTLRVGDR